MNHQTWKKKFDRRSLTLLERNATQFRFYYMTKKENGVFFCLLQLIIS